jgi:hypothetical protein
MLTVKSMSEVRKERARSLPSVVKLCSPNAAASSCEPALKAVRHVFANEAAGRLRAIIHRRGPFLFGRGRVHTALGCVQCILVVEIQVDTFDDTENVGSTVDDQDTE